MTINNLLELIDHTDLSLNGVPRHVPAGHGEGPLCARWGGSDHTWVRRYSLAVWTLHSPSHSAPLPAMPNHSDKKHQSFPILFVYYKNQLPQPYDPFIDDLLKWNDLLSNLITLDIDSIVYHLHNSAFAKRSLADEYFYCVYTGGQPGIYTL